MNMNVEKEGATDADEAEAEAAPPSQFGSLAGSIGARNLIIIIIAMPFVFFFGVMGAVALFGKPNETASTAIPPFGIPSNSPVNELPTSGDGIASAYPAGATPGAIALDGDRLAVRFDGPDGVVVIIYDLAQGEVIARVPFTDEIPAIANKSPAPESD